MSSKDLDELCDGLLIIWSNDEYTRVQNKAFTVGDINRLVPADCYELWEDEEEYRDTPLAFLVQNYIKGTSVSFKYDVYGWSPFASWMTGDDIKSYTVWGEYEGLEKHLKHLKDVAPQSETRTNNPLVVLFPGE